MTRLFGRLAAFSVFMGKTFAIWVIIFAFLAYYFPAGFTFLAPYISVMLGVVMFGMGLTLKARDFSEVFTRPLDVLIGILAQFVIMPVLAWVLCLILNLPAEIAVGVILVGCCPGGTSSNVMTYLAKGDVPLSVTITACTTCLAPLVTPALVFLFASQWVEVDPMAMFMSIVKIVIVPIVGGVIINTLFGKYIGKVTLCLPLISVVAIVGIVCAVVSISRDRIAETGALIFVVVVLHNCIGYLLGYLLSKMLKMPVHKQKTLAIEVGMQNSGLATALATAHFTPDAAVPGAVFSVWHNISGPIAASVLLRLRDPQMNKIYEKDNRTVGA